MASPELSIVIPTHKRANILLKCLEAIEKQTIAKRIEAIVVSDGHDDATSELMNHIGENERSPNASLAGFHFLEIPKSHQGVARNRGVEKATAPITLFLGDDMLLAPDACEMHVKAHRSYELRVASGSSLKTHNSKLAVLGHITWDPSLEITPAMRWLEKSGWQFGYPMIECFAHAEIPAAMQHRFTYTGNLSLPTGIARTFPFREDVSLYGWEDILWGTKLRDAGVTLFYEPDAKALHHHRMTLEDSLKRMETIGRSLKRMEEIDPTFDRIPRGIKLQKHQAAALLPGMRGSHERAFLRGLNNH